MLYIFAISDAPWVKAGWTNHSSPWHRVLRGLWSNVHPLERCGKLGYGGIELLALFEGDLALEQALHRALPADSFEFWRRDRVPELLAALAELGAVALPLPPKPEWTEPADAARRPCCGGPSYPCFVCDQVFGTWYHLKQHKAGVHNGRAVECVGCGKQIQHVRNLKAHRKVVAAGLGRGCKLLQRVEDASSKVS